MGLNLKDLIQEQQRRVASSGAPKDIAQLEKLQSLMDSESIESNKILDSIKKYSKKSSETLDDMKEDTKKSSETLDDMKEDIKKSSETLDDMKEGFTTKELSASITGRGSSFSEPKQGFASKAGDFGISVLGGVFDISNRTDKIIEEKNRRESFIQTETKLRGLEGTREDRKKLKEDYKTIKQGEQSLEKLDAETASLKSQGYNESQIEDVLGYKQKREDLVSKISAADPSRLKPLASPEVEARTSTVSKPAAGPQANQGIAGPQANQGIAGPQANQGIAGPQANQGIAGPQVAQQQVAQQQVAQQVVQRLVVTGPQANQGLAGPLVVTGPQANQGIAGPQGPAGADGLDGDRGSRKIADAEVKAKALPTDTLPRLKPLGPADVLDSNSDASKLSLANSPTVISRVNNPSRIKQSSSAAEETAAEAAIVQDKMLSEQEVQSSLLTEIRNLLKSGTKPAASESNSSGSNSSHENNSSLDIGAGAAAPSLLKKAGDLAKKAGGFAKNVGKSALTGVGGGVAGTLGKAIPLLAAGSSVVGGISDLAEGKKVESLDQVVPEGWNKLNPFDWAMRGGMYVGDKINKGVEAVSGGNSIGGMVYDLFNSSEPKNISSFDPSDPEAALLQGPEAAKEKLGVAAGNPSINGKGYTAAGKKGQTLSFDNKADLQKSYNMGEISRKSYTEALRFGSDKSAAVFPNASKTLDNADPAAPAAGGKGYTALGKDGKMKSYDTKADLLKAQEAGEIDRTSFTEALRYGSDKSAAVSPAQSNAVKTYNFENTAGAGRGSSADPRRLDNAAPESPSVLTKDTTATPSTSSSEISSKKAELAVALRRGKMDDVERLNRELKEIDNGSTSSSTPATPVTSAPATPVTSATPATPVTSAPATPATPVTSPTPVTSSEISSKKAELSVALRRGKMDDVKRLNRELMVLENKPAGVSSSDINNSAVKKTLSPEAASAENTSSAPKIVVQAPPATVIQTPAPPAPKAAPSPFTNNMRNSEPSVNSYLKSRYVGW